MKSFLLEIFSEEIPPLLQKKAADDFLQIAKSIFTEENLSFKNDDLQTFITPRRLILYIKNLKTKQTLPATQKIGPKVDANDKAIQGFLKANNLNNVSQLIKINNKGHQYYAFDIKEKSIKTQQILQNSLNKILLKSVNIWPRLMRWNVEGFEYQPQWIRPIRNLLCLFDNEIVDIEFANLKSNNLTFLNCQKKAKQINDINSYFDLIKKQNIIIDFNQRCILIADMIKQKANELALETVNKANDNLFEEVAGLCESPQILVGDIEPQFMSLPQEILILTLKNNQKYFCLTDKRGNLSTKFIFVIDGNYQQLDKSKIILDNQKIVKARLSDAKFFTDEDLKIPLIDRASHLKNIIFHQKLGTVADKSKRLSYLTKFLAIFVPHCDLLMIDRLTTLCKADLTTKAVAEFPELQGKIASYYAHKNNENDKIVAALYEQYFPISANSNLPKTSLGVVLSIADKIDTVVGLFLSGDKPTSSKDPYALRRAVLGVVRISFYHNIAFPIRALIEKSLKSYPNKLLTKYINKSQNATYKDKKTLISDIIIFFVERLKVYLKETDKLNPEIVNAVIDHYLNDIDTHKYCDILYISKKIRFLDKIIFDDNRPPIITLYKRVSKILQIEEKRDNKIFLGRPSKISFRSKEEVALYKMTRRIQNKFAKLIYKSDFKEALNLIQNLEDPLIRFFDNITINDDDQKIRENRLILLAMVRSVFEKIYGLSNIDIPN